jgi:hypothetical protein
MPMGACSIFNARHRHSHPLFTPSTRRSTRRRAGAAGNTGRQECGDELPRFAGGVLPRHDGFRPPAGGLRQGRHHRPDHQQSFCGGGDERDLAQARDRRRQAHQRPDRRGGGASEEQLGPRHAQSARCKPHRRGRALSWRARLQGTADHVELARPIHRRGRHLCILGMGASAAGAALHSSAAAYRSDTTSRWINTNSTSWSGGRSTPRWRSRA